MIASEILALKFNDFFGKQYKIYAEDAYDDNFTAAVDTPLGTQLAIEQQAFKKFNNKIVGVLRIRRPMRSNVDYYHIAGDYTIDFFVPVNFVKRNKSGQLIENPKYDFYGDCENIINNKIVNKTIEFNQNGTLYGRLTMSEPYNLGMQLLDTPNYKRKQMRIEGRFVITDNGFFGGDILFELNLGGVWYKIENINAIEVQSPHEASTTQDTGTLFTNSDIAQVNNVIALSIDMTRNVKNGNIAMLKFMEMVFDPQDINPASSTTFSLQRKLQIRMTVGFSHFTFWTVPTITLSAPRASIGTYTLTLHRDLEN